MMQRTGAVTYSSLLPSCALHAHLMPPFSSSVTLHMLRTKWLLTLYRMKQRLAVSGLGYLILIHSHDHNR